MDEAAARCRGDEDATAAIDELPGRADGLRDHPHGHGGDGEVVAAEPRDRICQRGADDDGRDDGPQQAEPGIALEVNGEEPGGVGADREEDVRPEVELPRPTADDVPPDAEHRVEQHEEAHGLVVDVAARLERDGIGEGGEGTDHPGNRVGATRARRRARSGQIAPGAGTGRSGCTTRRRRRP